MRYHRIILVVCLFASLWSSPNYAQEQQHWLQAGQQRVSASMSKSRKAATLGGVVVLATGGESGAWPHSLHALGRHLPDDGWSTLRVDLKTATPSAEQAGNEQLLQQISAAVEFLRKDGLQDIVLVAAGGVAFKTLQAPKDPRLAQLQGLVMLDINDIESSVEPVATFTELKIPILDLLTRRGAGKDAALQRKLLAQQSSMTNYRQVRGPAAGPNWSKRRDPVVQRVRGWLRRNWS